MKSALFIVAAAAGALAQDLSGLPACARQCIATAITAVCPVANDIACQCSPNSLTQIANSATPCLLQACAASPDALVQAATAGAALCADFSTLPTNLPTNTGAQTNLPPATTTPPSTAGGSGNGTITRPGVPTTTSQSTSRSTAAAATPVMLAGGALLGLIGAVAAL